MTENLDNTFGNAPVSINEKRADKERNATLWTPREALVSLLRDIDNGVVAPTDLIVAYRLGNDKDGYVGRFTCAGRGGLHVILGLLARAAYLMQTDD